MKFVLLFGPQAVGKMTVGQELAKITDLKLLHNHMTIDLLAPLFDFSPEMWRLSTRFREEIFESFSKTEKEGMIFTYVWAFNEQEDWDFVESVCTIFSDNGAEIYFVELEADVEERLSRNKTEHRLNHKPTKRNLEQSERNLLESMETWRLNSTEGEIDRENYLRINNTYKQPHETAQMIKNHFKM